MPEPLRVLVVSERYPPDVAGGGEISLATTLAAIAPGEVDLTVLAFIAPGATVPEVPGVERQSVVTAWPPTTAGRGRGLGMPAALAKYVTCGHAHTARRRFALVALRSTLRALGHESYFAFQDADVLADEGLVRMVRDRILRARPDVVHADNQIAILIAAAAMPGELPLVGMIRDNRFFCGRRDQRANIDGIPCRTCGFACTERLPRPLRGPAVRTMDESLALRTRALQRLDRAVVPSRYLAAQMGALRADLEVVRVPNPVALTPCARPPGQGARILAVGSVTAAKGQALLVEMLPRLLAGLPELRLELPGQPGPGLASLLQRARALGVEDAIAAPGFLMEGRLAAAYARASVVALPGHFQEGFGRVAVEAALAGRPVVAFRTGATPETVEDGVTGLLIEPGDRPGFERALQGLLTDPVRAAELGQAARRRADGRYGAEDAAERLLAVWRSAAAGGRR